MMGPTIDSVLACDWNTAVYVLQPPEPVSQPVLPNVAVA